MPSKKISELDAVASLTGAELVPVVQGGDTESALISDIRTYMLGVANTFTQSSKFTAATDDGAVRLESATPVLAFVETDGAATNQFWRLVVSGERFLGQTRTDAGAAGATWLAVDRTGTTVDSITFSAPFVVSSPASAASPTIKAEGAAASVALWETDAAADNGKWDFLVNGEALTGRVVNDAASVADTWLSVERTGTTVDTIDLRGTSVAISTAAGAARISVNTGITGAGNTALSVYDVDNAQIEQVSVGAADSGGSGFKLLRIPN